MKFVIFPPVDQARLARIRQTALDWQVVCPPDAQAALHEITDADAFFGKLTRPLLAAATRLKWVQSPTASLEHYLFPELVEHPCQLSNMRGLFSDVIADQVLGYVLCFARQLHTYIRQQERRLWQAAGGEQARSDFISGPGQVSTVDQAHQHLADLTLGVVGVGAIGREILKRARAFSMKVCGVDPITRTVPDILDEVWPLDRRNDLLAASDYVVIAAPHTPETERLFRAEAFREMKKTAVLINIGRGAIVDLADLTTALQGGTIAGAALDVFEVEPLPADHPLWGMPNVIITPHIAGASPRIAERHLETLLENIRQVAAGKSPVTLVDKRKWY